MNYFVTAIGTDSGKTLFSAILTEYLKADYWKPVQAGNPRDTETVQSLISNKKTKFHPEAYFLETPASPHASAKIDGIEIDLKKIALPTQSSLVIEGAGGLMVPLNKKDYVIDLAAQLKTEVILVADLYLGSINHTLLSIEYLKNHDIPVKGIVFNGPSNPESEHIIMENSSWPCLMKIPLLSEVSPSRVKAVSEKLKLTWHE